jgi:SAM-dependent methyltransferase
MGLLHDLRHRDPEALHRFLWSNHLAYAKTYEVSKKFGASNVNPSRHILFSEMADYLSRQGVDPRTDIRSVFEVGCSTGHLLRHLETEVFPSAEALHGLDIDQHAIDAGAAHLGSLNSRVRLIAADMTDTARIMSDQAYDVVLCCGSLMYVAEEIAEQTVRAMLSHARRLVGIICLANPESKALTSLKSVTRFQDAAFIHNVHRMIVRNGGRIVCSRRVGTEVSGSSPSYAILSVPTV